MLSTTFLPAASQHQRRLSSTFSATASTIKRTRQPVTYNIPSVWVRTVSARGMTNQTVIPPVVQHIGTKSPFSFSIFSIDSNEVFTTKVSQKHSLDDYNTLVFAVGNNHYVTRTFPSPQVEHLVSPPVLVKQGAFRQSELPIDKPRTGRIFALMYKPQPDKDKTARAYQKLTLNEAENNFLAQARQSDIPDLPFMRLETYDLSRQKQASVLKFNPCPYPVLYVIATNPDDTSSQAIIRPNNASTAMTANRQQQILLPANTPHEIILDGEGTGTLLRIVDPKRS